MALPAASITAQLSSTLSASESHPGRLGPGCRTSPTTCSRAGSCRPAARPPGQSGVALRLYESFQENYREAVPSPYAGRSLDAESCHWCREKFQHGQMRYPILDDSTAGWALHFNEHIDAGDVVFRHACQPAPPSPRGRRTHAVPPPSARAYAVRAPAWLAAAGTCPACPSWRSAGVL
jgi:hypothetical protein